MIYGMVIVGLIVSYVIFKFVGFLGLFIYIILTGIFGHFIGRFIDAGQKGKDSSEL